MKFVKSADWKDITTSVDGVLYHIGQNPIVVSDEIASTLKGQFLHEIELTDIPEAEDVSSDDTEEKPKKRGRPAKEANE